MANEYSTTWFKHFLSPIGSAQTEKETAFVHSILPLESYRAILDLCCGEGRHCASLARAGYQVTGMDRSAAALAEARKSSSTATFIEGDMRRFPIFPTPFDAVLNLWQSFGYFDEAANGDILSQIHKALRPGGRLILDVYHRAFFAQPKHQGTRSFSRNGQTIKESKMLRGKRLFVELDYGMDRPPDQFDWHVYTPEELVDLAQNVGFSAVQICSGFNISTSADPASPRVQLIFKAN